MLRASDLSDEELARRAQMGERVWLDELFRRHRRRMLGCAYRMVTPGEVEDAVQEIALRVMNGLPGFRGDSSVGTWIYSVARYTCLDVRRRRRPTVELSAVVDRETDETTSPEYAFNLSIMACRTATAIAELPEGQREVVMLRLGEALSTEATAERLGISVDAVKARLRRARAALRDELGEVVVCPACGPGAYSLDARGVQASDAAGVGTR